MSKQPLSLAHFFLVFAAIQPLSYAGNLPRGFRVEIKRGATHCSPTLLKPQFVQGQSAVLFQSSQPWTDSRFWQGFGVELKRLFPGSQIFIDSRNSAFAVSGGEELFGTHVILTHTQGQIRVEWTAQEVEPQSTAQTSAAEESAEAEQKRRPVLWDVPSESDPVSGRTRWDSELSDTVVPPRGTHRGNRGP